MSSEKKIVITERDELPDLVHRLATGKEVSGYGCKYFDDYSVSITKEQFVEFLMGSGDITHVRVNAECYAPDYCSGYVMHLRAYFSRERLETDEEYAARLAKETQQTAALEQQTAKARAEIEANERAELAKLQAKYGHRQNNDSGS